MSRFILQSDPKYGVFFQPMDETALDPYWGYNTQTESGYDTMYSVTRKPQTVNMSGFFDFSAQLPGFVDMQTRLSGGTERWAIVGRTLDQNSNAVANMTVYIVDIPNQVVTDSTTSDQSGFYEVGNVYGAGRGQAIAYRPGSPDLAGASDDNLP